ncbi:hypothetical protein KAS41_02570 [Candidatus Parcubacteria bacterium]|nr:hypothetical protein [Candidatus Parcubacteria bacterium]
MTIAGRIIFGLIGIAVGYLFVRYSEWFFRTIGSIGWAEKWLHGEGGTRLVLKLFGILIIFLSCLMITGLLGGFTRWLLSPIINLYQ